jgi:hypothetical protein
LACRNGAAKRQPRPAVLDHAAILAGLALAHSPQRQSLVSDVAHDRAPRGDWESVVLHVRNALTSFRGKNAPISGIGNGRASAQ